MMKTNDFIIDVNLIECSGIIIDDIKHLIFYIINMNKDFCQLILKIKQVRKFAQSAQLIIYFFIIV